MRSPLTISYNDLINSVESRLNWMKANYPRMKLEGQINEWKASRDITIQETLLKLLKKHKRDPQLNLNDLFEKIK